MILNNIKEMKKDRGFTIVELLIVIVIIAILAAITIVAYNGITARANTTKAQTNAASAQKVAEAFNADNGRYPATTAEFGTGTSAKLPSGVTVAVGLPGTSGAFTGTEPTLSGSNGLTTVSYSCTTASCANTPGGRIRYWDFTTGTFSTNVIYVGSASVTSTFFAPAS